MKEELFILTHTKCCNELVEIPVSERYLLEEEFEVTCPFCGKVEKHK